MRASVRVITIGVADLERSLAFYRDGLGFATEGIVGTEFEGGAVVFIELAGGISLALYPLAELRKSAGLPPVKEPVGEARFTLGHNVASAEEVDAVLAEARAAGAPYATQGAKTAWGGYLGTFSDPDGHLWEVVWNPDLGPL
jgi:catechol 2,3-dioxygenase-like lactoylglutathione lyase family enzyme